VAVTRRPAAGPVTRWPGPCHPAGEATGRPGQGRRRRPGARVGRAERHRGRGGRYVVGLVAAHGAAIWWGYAVQTHTGLVSEAGSRLTQYPDVLMATVAGCLLIGVGVVSMRAARRRIRYATWYYLHLYTYLAIALAFSHQLAVGASFVSSLAARFWWSAMYLAVAALVLWYRFAVPLRAFARQFFRWRFLTPAATGSGRRVLLLAGGVGITPLRALFAALPGQVTLIYRASSERDLVFRDELDRIAPTPAPRPPSPRARTAATGSRSWTATRPSRSCPAAPPRTRPGSPPICADGSRCPVPPAGACDAAGSRRPRVQHSIRISVINNK